MLIWVCSCSSDSANTMVSSSYLMLLMIFPFVLAVLKRLSGYVFSAHVERQRRQYAPLANTSLYVDVFCVALFCSGTSYLVTMMSLPSKPISPTTSTSIYLSEISVRPWIPSLVSGPFLKPFCDLLGNASHLL